MPEPLDLRGLVAATFTPFKPDASLDLARIGPMVDFLISQNIAGLYVLGSTGEGLSLTMQERCQVAETFVRAAAGRVPVIVQVGCESLMTAKQLAEHAAAKGADAISAVSPVYFKPDSMESLIDSMALVASGAPSLPFYYYHIPAVSGVAHDMVEFLDRGGAKIRNLCGIKFTSPSVHEFQACVAAAGTNAEILWGTDEMLLSGLVAGARAAVGSTYNYAGPIYQKLLADFAGNDIAAANIQQQRSQQLVRAFVPYGPRSAQKAIMKLIDQDCGPTRLPNIALNNERIESLRKRLDAINFFDWS